MSLLKYLWSMCIILKVLQCSFHSRLHSLPDRTSLLKSRAFFVSVRRDLNNTDRVTTLDRLKRPRYSIACLVNWRSTVGTNTKKYPPLPQLRPWSLLLNTFKKESRRTIFHYHSVAARPFADCCRIRFCPGGKCTYVGLRKLWIRALYHYEIRRCLYDSHNLSHIYDGSSFLAQKTKKTPNIACADTNSASLTSTSYC